MISSALFCDALIGNFQEKMMKKHNASNAEIVLYSYFIGFLYLLCVLLVSGEFRDGTQFCIQVTETKNVYKICVVDTIFNYCFFCFRIQ